MNKLKSIWTSITGSLSSIVPLFFACCKSGACIGVCASPVASLFGISTAGLANSPILNAIVPILIALSAVSFTISYYSLYVLPKFNNCNTDCNCDTNQKSNRKEKVSKAIFWIGLIASIFFFTYFEVQKYNADNSSAVIQKTECCSEPVNDSLNIQSAADTSDIKEKPCCTGTKKCE